MTKLEKLRVAREAAERVECAARAALSVSQKNYVKAKKRCKQANDAYHAELFGIYLPDIKSNG